MQQIFDKYDKSRLTELPRVTFPGRVFVIVGEEEASRAVDYLLTQPILGFDTETRPTFRRGEMRQVALLQVATPETAFLFRLCRTGLTDSIVRLLSDTTIEKVGLSLKDDFHNLHRTRPFRVGTFVELQEEVKKIGIEDMSLQKIYANLFGQRISKGQQLTNWEADTLTAAQQQYASIDAWTCIHIHQRVQQLMASGDYQLVRTATETPSAPASAATPDPAAAAAHDTRHHSSQHE